MKICHVITRMIVGGAMENTLLTCEGLHARGHEVTLITGPALGPEGELMTRAESGGYRVIVVDALRREIHLLRDRAAYFQIGRHVLELRPDVVHTHASKAGILGRKAAAKIGGMKIVHTIHGLALGGRQSRWRNWLFARLERKAARHTDALISVADAMTAKALAHRVGRPEQFTTIYSGMEVQRFVHRPPETDAVREAMKLPPDAVLVTKIARLAEEKGHEYVLDAAGRVEDPRVHFCLVGDGALRREIEAQLAVRGLAPRFRLTGLVRPEEIPALLHASDMIVHCSLREGLARVLPQGMLAGKPVISFDVDGAREVVDAETGVLLEPGDVSGLALAVETLAGSKELRDKLGAAGRERCRGRFDHERMVDAIEGLYERLMGAEPVAGRE
jgi:glycosyltransferase involved in cell wall biosynthesis